MCAAASVVFFCLSLIWAQLARVMPSTAFYFYEVSDFSLSGENQGISLLVADVINRLMRCQYSLFCYPLHDTMA